MRHLSPRRRAVATASPPPSSARWLRPVRDSTVVGRDHHSTAASDAGPSTGPTGTVSTVPASFTPWLSQSGAGAARPAVRAVRRHDVRRRQDQHRQPGHSTYPRSNAFSFSATTGAVTSWAPQVNGTGLRGRAVARLLHRLPRRGVLGCQRDPREEHRRGGHLDRSDPSRVRQQRQRSGRDAALHRGHAARRRQLHLHQRGQADRARQPVPTTGAVTGYANLAISGGYPAEPPDAALQLPGQPRRHQDAGRGRLHLDRRPAPPAGRHAGLSTASAVSVDRWYAAEFNQLCRQRELRGQGRHVVTRR